MNKSDSRQGVDESDREYRDPISDNFSQSRTRNNDFCSPLDLHLDSVWEQGVDVIE